MARQWESDRDWRELMAAQIQQAVFIGAGAGDQTPPLEELMPSRSMRARQQRAEQELMRGFGAL